MIPGVCWCFRGRKMNLNWDYAKLSHLAKEAGGPEKFAEAIYQQGIEAGKAITRTKDLKIAAVALVSATALIGTGYALKKITKYYDDKKVEKLRSIEDETLSMKEQFIVAMEEKDNTI